MKIFKIYYMRSILKNFKIVIPVLLGCLISATLISTTIFMVDNIKCYVNKYSYLINHGDLSVSQRKLPFAEEDYDKKNNIFEDYLKENTKVHYVTEQYMRPDTNASIEVYDGKTIIGDSYWYRIIDYNNLNRYMELNKVSPENSVILSKSMAKRLNAKKGDKIKILFDLKAASLDLIINEIIPDNEVNIPSSNLGYIFMDRSFYENYNNINSSEFNNIGLKKFYIDGKESNLKEVEEKAQEVYGDYAKIIYISDLLNSAQTFYRLPIGFLSFFSLICFILSSLGLINLIHIIVIERQKDIAVLKVLGLKDNLSKLYVLLEILILVLPILLLGVLGGYLNFRNFLLKMPSLGIASLSGSDLLFSTLKIFSINFLAVLFLGMPIIVFTLKRSIVDILRGNNITKKHKRQMLLVAICVTAEIFVIFKIIINSTDIIYMQLIMLAVVVILMLVSFLLTKILHLLKGKSVYRISISSLLRNKTRVPITIITYTFCFTMIFMVLLINYSLSSMATDKGIKDFDYDVEVRTDERATEIIERYISLNRINNFYKIKGYNAKVNDLSFILDVFDFSNYKGPFKEKIKEELNLGGEFSYIYNLEQNSLININLKGNDITFVIREKNYSSPILEDRYLEAGITESSISKKDIELGDPVVISYFFNTDYIKMNDLVKLIQKNEGIMLITINDVINNKLAEIEDYKYLINNMTIYFLLGTVIVVLTSSIITFLERKKEFGLYIIFGANRNTLKKSVFFENVILAIFGGVIGSFLSMSLLKLISKILYFPLQMNFTLELALLGAFMMVSVIVTRIIIEIVPFDTVDEIIREE